MKSVGYIIFLTAVVGFLSLPARSGTEPDSLKERPFMMSRPHPALVGIDEFHAILLRSGADPSADGLDWMQLKAEVTGELHQAKIKLIAGPTDDLENSPELRIYINLLKIDDPRQYVFRIQTCVARSVCLKAQDQPAFKADLWTLNPAFEAVSVDDMPARITEVVLGQIKAFIRAYQTAYPQSRSLSDFGTNNTGSTASGNPAEADTKSPTAGHGYVASNSSDIFHKSDCPWAKNISPENLVIYPSREHAVMAGKRPCKWCKP